MLFLHAQNHNENKKFTYITWAELTEKIKQPIAPVSADLAKCKTNSPVIAAHDAPAKTKEAAINHNNFTMLRLDLDNVTQSIVEVKNELLGLGIESFIIHTTASHDPHTELNRFRVYIELAASLSLEHWQQVETYLSFIFNADDCSARPYQIMYLPFQSETYEYHINEGKALALSGSELLSKAQQYHQQDKERYIAQIQAKHRDKPKAEEYLIGTQVSIIDLVNTSYLWDDLLRDYGYKQQGKAWLPPESTQGNLKATQDKPKAGAYILTSHTDGKERYYSHHAHDPCASDKCLDKFDFICIREYNGNVTEALKDIAQKEYPEAHKHNRKEWVIHQRNQRIKSNFEVIK